MMRSIFKRSRLVVVLSLLLVFVMNLAVVVHADGLPPSKEVQKHDYVTFIVKGSDISKTIQGGSHAPGSISYNDGTYAGTLTKTYDQFQTPVVYEQSSIPEQTTYKIVFHIIYSGVVSTTLPTSKVVESNYYVTFIVKGSDISKTMRGGSHAPATRGYDDGKYKGTLAKVYDEPQSPVVYKPSSIPGQTTYKIVFHVIYSGEVYLY